MPVYRQPGPYAFRPTPELTPPVWKPPIEVDEVVFPQRMVAPELTPDLRDFYGIGPGDHGVRLPRGVRMTKDERALMALYAAPVDLTSEDDFQALLDEIDDDLHLPVMGSRSVERRQAPDMILGEYGVAPADVLALVSVEESIGFGADPKPAPFKKVSDFFVKRMADGSTKADQALEAADKKIAQARLVKSRIETIRQEVAPGTAAVAPEPGPVAAPAIEPAPVSAPAPAPAASAGMSPGMMMVLGGLVLAGVGVGVYAYAGRR